MVDKIIQPDNANSDDRRERFQTLAGLSRPAPGTSMEKDFRKTLGDLEANPRLRARFKEMHDRAMASITSQVDSGAGYASDQALRELEIEYNSRLFSHGSTSLPTSFNIAEAFFYRPAEFFAFLLYPEEDYLLSYTDFLDFVTSTDAPALDLGTAARIPQNVIVNVNSLDTPGALLLDAQDGSSFCFVGASYVRRGDELSVLMMVGEAASDDELAHLNGLLSADFVAPPTKANIEPSSDHKKEVVFLDEERQFVRVLALCRFNLKERRLEARSLMKDLGDNYSVVTDIADTLHPLFGDTEQWAEKMGQRLDEVGVVWEMAKMLVLLPAYLEFRLTLVQNEQRTTKLGLQMKNSLKGRRAAAKALPESRVVFRRISAIRVENAKAPQQIAGRCYVPPLFQVPVAGFWRAFTDPTTQGHDAQGEPVIGRTWVRSHIRHKDKSVAPGPKVVYIKSSLAQARRQLARYRNSAAVMSVANVTASKNHAPTATVHDAFVGKSDGAFVYVLRCPAHSRDIYKVGHTDRDPEERARELSRVTSTPTPFLVVQAWAVSRGYEAEQAAHAALDGYRVDDRREFFRTDYAVLREALEKAIGPWIV